MLFRPDSRYYPLLLTALQWDLLDDLYYEDGVTLEVTGTNQIKVTTQTQTQFGLVLNDDRIEPSELFLPVFAPRTLHLDFRGAVRVDESDFAEFDRECEERDYWRDFIAAERHYDEMLQRSIPAPSPHPQPTALHSGPVNGDTHDRW